MFLKPSLCSPPVAQKKRNRRVMPGIQHTGDTCGKDLEAPKLSGLHGFFTTNVFLRPVIGQTNLCRPSVPRPVRQETEGYLAAVRLVLCSWGVPRAVQLCHGAVRSCRKVTRLQTWSRGLGMGPRRDHNRKLFSNGRTAPEQNLKEIWFCS